MRKHISRHASACSGTYNNCIVFLRLFFDLEISHAIVD